MLAPKLQTTAAAMTYTPGCFSADISSLFYGWFLIDIS